MLLFPQLYKIVTDHHQVIFYIDFHLLKCSDWSYKSQMKTIIINQNKNNATIIKYIGSNLEGWAGNPETK